MVGTMAGRQVRSRIAPLRASLSGNLSRRLPRDGVINVGTWKRRRTKSASGAEQRAMAILQSRKGKPPSAPRRVVSLGSESMDGEHSSMAFPRTLLARERHHSDGGGDSDSDVSGDSDDVADEIRRSRSAGYDIIPGTAQGMERRSQYRPLYGSTPKGALVRQQTAPARPPGPPVRRVVSTGHVAPSASVPSTGPNMLPHISKSSHTAAEVSAASVVHKLHMDKMQKQHHFHNEQQKSQAPYVPVIPESVSQRRVQTSHVDMKGEGATVATSGPGVLEGLVNLSNVSDAPSAQSSRAMNMSDLEPPMNASEAGSMEAVAWGRSGAQAYAQREQVMLPATFAGDTTVNEEELQSVIQGLESKYYQSYKKLKKNYRARLRQQSREGINVAVDRLMGDDVLRILAKHDTSAPHAWDLACEIVHRCLDTEREKYIMRTVEQMTSLQIRCGDAEEQVAVCEESHGTETTQLMEKIRTLTECINRVGRTATNLSLYSETSMEVLASMREKLHMCVNGGVNPIDMARDVERLIDGLLHGATRARNDANPVLAFLDTLWQAENEDGVYGGKSAFKKEKMFASLKSTAVTKESALAEAQDSSMTGYMIREQETLMSSLRQKLEEANAEVRRVVGENATMASANEALRGVCERQANELAKLGAALRQTVTANDSQQATVVQVSEELKFAREALVERDASLQELRESLTKGEVDYRSLDESLGARTKELTLMTGEVKSNRAKIAALLKERFEVAQKFTGAMDDMNTSHLQVMQRIESGSIVPLLSRLAGAECAVERVRGAMERERAVAREILDREKASRARVEAEFEGSTAEIKQARTTIQEYEKWTEDLRAQNRKGDSILASYIRCIRAAVSRMNELVTARRCETVALEAAMRRCAVERDRFIEERDDLVDTKKNFGKEIHDLQDTIKKLRRTILDLESKLSHRKTALEQVKSSAERIRRDTERCTQANAAEVERLTQALSESETKTRSLGEQVMALEQTVQLGRSELDSRAARARDDREKADQDIAGAKERLADTEKEVIALRKRLHDEIEKSEERMRAVQRRAQEQVDAEKIENVRLREELKDEQQSSQRVREQLATEQDRCRRGDVALEEVRSNQRTTMTRVAVSVQELCRREVASIRNVLRASKKQMDNEMREMKDSITEVTFRNQALGEAFQVRERSFQDHLQQSMRSSEATWDVKLVKADRARIDMKEEYDKTMANLKKEHREELSRRKEENVRALDQLRRDQGSVLARLSHIIAMEGHAWCDRVLKVASDTEKLDNVALAQSCILPPCAPVVGEQTGTLMKAILEDGSIELDSSMKASVEHLVEVVLNAWEAGQANVERSCRRMQGSHLQKMEHTLKVHQIQVSDLEEKLLKEQEAMREGMAIIQSQEEETHGKLRQIHKRMTGNRQELDAVKHERVVLQRKLEAKQEGLEQLKKELEHANMMGAEREQRHDMVKKHCKLLTHLFKNSWRRIGRFLSKLEELGVVPNDTTLRESFFQGVYEGYVLENGSVVKSAGASDGASDHVSSVPSIGSQSDFSGCLTVWFNTMRKVLDDRSVSIAKKIEGDCARHYDNALKDDVVTTMTRMRTHLRDGLQSIVGELSLITETILDVTARSHAFATMSQDSLGALSAVQVDIGTGVDEGDCDLGTVMSSALMGKARACKDSLLRIRGTVERFSPEATVIEKVVSNQGNDGTSSGQAVFTVDVSTPVKESYDLLAVVVKAVSDLRFMCKECIQGSCSGRGVLLDQKLAAAAVECAPLLQETLENAGQTRESEKQLAREIRKAKERTRDVERSLKRAQSSYEEDAEKWRDERGTLQQQVRTLEKDLDNARGDVKRSAEVVAHVEESIMESPSTSAGIKAVEEEAKRKVKRMQKRVDRYKAERDKLMADKKKLVRDNKAMATNWKALMNELKQAEGGIASRITTFVSKLRRAEEKQHECLSEAEKKYGVRGGSASSSRVGSPMTVSGTSRDSTPPSDEASDPPSARTE